MQQEGRQQLMVSHLYVSLLGSWLNNDVFIITVETTHGVPRTQKKYIQVLL